MKEFKKQRRESCYESGTLKISKVEGLVRRREMMKMCKEMPKQFINTRIIYENTRIVKSGPLRPKPNPKAVQNPNPSPIGTGADSIITWATTTTPPITFNHEGVL